MLKEKLRGLQFTKTQSMLRSVQINPTELCNRKCSFCPRSDSNIYKNQSKHISLKTIEKLCHDLNEINFNNRIGFAGFGEPLLHTDIFSCIKKVKDIIPDINFLEIVTNGDKLTSDVIKKLYESSCTTICVSMYDEDKTDYFNSLKGDLDINMVFAHNYNVDNMMLVNRSEILKNDGVNLNKPCYIPFYKALIDWNGDVLLCENDWSKNKVFGNIHDDSFKNIWFGSSYNKHRNVLLNNREIYPCNNCNACGIIRGIESVNIFKEING